MSEIIEALNWRYATKKFDSEKKIPQKDFDELLESLRLAPSSFGLEPWKFIVVEDKDLREKIKKNAWNQTQITDASHLIVLCAKKTITFEDIENFVERVAEERDVDAASLEHYKGMIHGFRKGVDDEFVRNWNRRQTYIALGFLLESAALKKIDACPMEGFNAAAVDGVLDLTESDYGVVALCPVGYRASDDKYAHLKKVRLSRDEVVEFR